MTALRAASWLVVAAALGAAGAGCSSCARDDRSGAADAGVGAQTWLGLVAEMQTVTGSSPSPAPQRAGGTTDQVALFAVPPDRARDVVAQHQRRFLAKGAYLALYDSGSARKPAYVALAHTTSMFDAVRMIGTTARRPPHRPDDIAKWLEALDKKQPLRLTGIGQEFIEGEFLDPVRDPNAIAADVEAFAPEFAEKGLAGLFPPDGAAPDAGDLARTWFAHERRFYLFWD